mgnify:CR=1 FL=1
MPDALNHRPSRAAGIFVLFVAVVLVFLTSVLSVRLHGDIKKGFKECPDDDAGCGVFGEELEDQLSRIYGLTLGLLGVQIATFLLFVTKGFCTNVYHNYLSGAPGRALMFGLLIGSFTISTVLLGAVSLDNLSFLKNNAIAGDWSYDRSVNAIEMIVAIIFIMSLVVMVTGDRLMPPHSTQRTNRDIEDNLLARDGSSGCRNCGHPLHPPPVAHTNRCVQCNCSPCACRTTSGHHRGVPGGVIYMNSAR